MNKSETVKLQLCVMGDANDIQAALWKTERFFGKLKDFSDFFLDKWTPPETEEDDGEFDIIIENVEELTEYLTVFKGLRIRLSLCQTFRESEKTSPYLDISWHTYSKKEMIYLNANWQNHLQINIDTEKVGVEAQSRINKAIEILQGVSMASR